MKIKFIGATPAEDHIVEIPEGTKEVSVNLPEHKAVNSPWPSVTFFCCAMICLTIMVWIFNRG